MCSSYAVIEALGQRCDPPRQESGAGWIYFLSKVDPTAGNLTRNKPDEKETGNEGTYGCHRP
jgi:hypothetical protein